MVLVALLILSFKNDGITQDSIGFSPPDPPLAKLKRPDNKSWVLATLQTGLCTGTLLSLDKVWYSKYDKSAFHTFNDWNEWQQMDKLGHFYSAYQITEQTAKLWNWTGVDKKRSIVIGSMSSLVFMNSIELMDAYSAKWGFSTSDMISNCIGTGFYIGQSLLWDEQRIRLKFSYHPISYGNLSQRAEQLFGKSYIERALKDYNGQTYWGSICLGSIFPKSNFPKWFCLSIGYGSDNMLGGFNNNWITNSPEYILQRDVVRNRRFLFSFDLDLSKIKSKNKFFSSVLSVMNTLKIPAPTLIINTKGKPLVSPFYF